MSPEQNLDVSIDGTNASPFDYYSTTTLNEGNAPNGQFAGLSANSGKIFVKTGPRRIAAAFVQSRSEIFEDDIAPIENTLIDTDMGTDGELTAMPHVREIEITGPFNTAGVSDSMPRRRVFTCRPLSAQEEVPCATGIITNIARQAYRRPVTDTDVKSLMVFYQQGHTDGHDFESGIRRALEAILVSPSFLFKIEPTPASTAANGIYRISDTALAS